MKRQVSAQIKGFPQQAIGSSFPNIIADNGVMRVVDNVLLPK